MLKTQQDRIMIPELKLLSECFDSHLTHIEYLTLFQARQSQGEKKEHTFWKC